MFLKLFVFYCVLISSYSIKKRNGVLLKFNKINVMYSKTNM